jgi:hypothetical protein
MKRTCLAAALLAFPIALASTQDSSLRTGFSDALCDALAHDPECELPQGSTVTVSVQIRQESTPTSANVFVDGRVAGKPELGTTIINKRKVEYRDRILRIADERLQNWDRTFIEARWERETIFPEKAGENSQYPESTVSPAEGRTLVFDWVSDSSRFKVSCSEEPEIAPPSLVQSTFKPSVSASFLCPKEPRAIGESWTVSTSDLRDLLLQPCGDLFAIPRSSDTSQIKFRHRQTHALWNSLEGDLRAKLALPDEDDAPSLVRISISGKLRTQFTVPFVDGKDAARQAKTDLEISGTWLWDKDARRLVSIALDGIGKSELSDDVPVDGPSGTVSGKLETRMDEKFHWELDCQYEASK